MRKQPGLSKKNEEKQKRIQEKRAARRAATTVRQHGGVPLGGGRRVVAAPDLAIEYDAGPARALELYRLYVIADVQGKLGRDKDGRASGSVLDALRAGR